MNVSQNRDHVRHLVEEAANSKSQLILFPELSILEFFPRQPHNYDYFDLAEPIPGPTSQWFADVAKNFGIAIVYNHYERSAEHLFFDCSVVIDSDGQLVGRQRMMHIAEEPGYNERFYYTPGWDNYNVFELNGWRFGIAICYDRHFPEVFRSLLLNGAELVLVPTAVAKSEPFADVYEVEMRAAAVANGIYIAVANRAGHEDPLEFMGQSMIIDPMGNVVNKLSEAPQEVLTIDIDKKTVTKGRTLFPFLRDRRADTYCLEGQRRGLLDSQK